MVTSHPAKYALAEYTLDTGNFNLLLNGKTIPLEPKVFAVLMHLIQQYPRFVTLEQLHEQVWQGRVVSDTAVRRTISKLRQALNDTDSDPPRFIKSQMKRGYALVISPDIIERVAEDRLIAGTASNVSPAAGPLLSPSLAAAEQSVKRRRPAAALILLLVFLLILLGVGGYQFSSRLLSNPQSAPASLALAVGESLIDIPGEKVDLALSADGRFLAFSASVKGHGGWQLFLHDRFSGQIKPLPTTGSHAVTTLSFIRDDSAVVYIDIAGERCRLYLLELKEGAQPQLLVDQQFTLGNVLYHSALDRLIYNATAAQGDNGYYYSYDLASGGVQQLTFSAASMIVDLGGSLSPDQQQLAMVRYRGQHDEFRLQIYQLASKQLLQETALPVRATQILWPEQDQLVLLDQGGTAWRYQLSNQQLSEITLAGNNRIRRLFITLEQQLLAILRPAVERSYIEASWPDRQTKQFYRFNKPPLALAYSPDPQKLWLTQRHADEYQLRLYDTNSQQQQPVISLENDFQLLSQSPDQQYLLLKMKKRLWLLQLSNNQLTAISAQTQVVESGFFSADSQQILFTENEAGRWRVNRYLISAGTTDRFSQDYRLFIPLGNEFLAVDPQGQFHRLDSTLQQVVKQDARMMFDVPYQVNIYGDTLLFSNMQMADTFLWQFSAQQPDISQQVLPRNELDPRLSISPDGKKALYFNIQRNSDRIVNLGKVL
ncbi:winged helix-turn-helix domain-containing protein [Arsukibacterium sp.]|uniref:winged helix-turn-helix domain-containing protein n=1 Tax=Arsukibacterium sp. TaxID=1977258 RepID=UPI001BD44A10|nr:winged helix-turn-helix domain-containing protein [Arsukibacterium sp.]